MKGPAGMQAGLLGPVGLPMIAGFAFSVGMISALGLYGIWSFTEYRQLRRRLPETKPPSPFKQPSRLGTILWADDGELSEYGRRVRLTGWALMFAAGMTALIAYLLSTAS